MIEGWEEETADLTENDKIRYLNPIATAFYYRQGYGKEKIISSPKICDAMEKYGAKITPTKLRKVIQYIRQHHVIKCLVSNSKGYWIAETEEECQKTIDSLRARARACERDADALEEDMREKFIH